MSRLAVKLAMSLVAVADINAGTWRHMSVAEAAQYFGVAESTIRRGMRSLGAARAGGKIVKGGVLIRLRGFSLIPAIITYSRSLHGD